MIKVFNTPKAWIYNTCLNCGKAGTKHIDIEGSDESHDFDLCTRCFNLLQKKCQAASKK